MKDWTGNRKSTFVTLGASNHTDKEREWHDFYATDTMPKECTCIITNPPYKYATEFVRHALDLLPEDGWCIMFLKTTFLEGQKRWKEIYSSAPPSTFYNSARECYVPRTGNSSGCETLEGARWPTHGMYGEKAMLVIQ